MIACPLCGASEFQVKCGFDRTRTIQRYKCLYCSRSYTPGLEYKEPPPKLTRVRRECIQCGTETLNPKFCSRACAATYNNSQYPKRKKRERFCVYCGKPVNGHRIACDDCDHRHKDWSKRTIAEIQKSAKYQVSAALRTLARQVYRQSGRPRTCQNCGYGKHVEICHIRAIGTFAPDTPVALVSGIENLVALCPNCHWEFDHGPLRYEDILPSK